jgi:hypothetical protein
MVAALPSKARAPGPGQETTGVFTRLIGALLRAVLVVALVAAPSLLLPTVSDNGRQAVALVAIFVGAFVLVEYGSTYPGLVEFRHAPPFNRLRFLCILATVSVTTILVRGVSAATPLTRAVEAVGVVVGNAIDFPYSPVRLLLMLLPANADPVAVHVLRAAAGLCCLIALITLAIFLVLVRAGVWPGSGGAFNVWVNLPTFDPTPGHDVVVRLERDARLNIALGFLLPFLSPAVFKAAAVGFIPVALDHPQMLIWTMAAWSFLPLSLLMRGIAMARLAEMIRTSRARAVAADRAMVAAGAPVRSAGWLPRSSRSFRQFRRRPTRCGLRRGRRG